MISQCICQDRNGRQLVTSESHYSRAESKWIMKFTSDQLRPLRFLAYYIDIFIKYVWRLLALINIEEVINSCDDYPLPQLSRFWLAVEKLDLALIGFWLHCIMLVTMATVDGYFLDARYTWWITRFLLDIPISQVYLGTYLINMSM